MSEYKKEQVKFIILLLLSVILISISTFLTMHSLKEEIVDIKKSQQDIITILEQ